MSKFELINAVVNEDDEGFLSRVKSKIFGKGQSPAPAASQPAAQPSNAPAKAQQAQTDEKEENEGDSPEVDTEFSILSKFASKLRDTPKGETRVVLRMSQEDLGKHYLKKGGGADYIKTLPDEVVKAIALHPQHPEKVTKNQLVSAEIEALPRGYSFSRLIKSDTPGHDVTVLLNVPDFILSELISAGKSSDVNAARAALTKMMNHKYYVMTLSNSKAKKIAGKMDSAFGDLEDTMHTFSPTIVKAYPNLREFKQIKDEWAALSRDRAEHNNTKAKEQEPKSAESPSPAQDKKPKETPAEKPQETPAEVPIDDDSSVEGSDIAATTKQIQNIWNNFAKSLGSKGERLNAKEYKKLPIEQRAALQQQLLKMAKAVGWNEDAINK